jgi:GTPase
VFVDQARIVVHAGRGGAGCISFRREKFVPKGGPDGGDGGKGGSVWLEADARVRTLLDCRLKHEYRADNGGAGSGNNRTGKDGEDLIVRLPPGTVVRDTETEETIADLVAGGDRLQVVRGGRGGRGNARFATATNQAPRRADPGESGTSRTLELQLKLIADVGFVGLPNAGKSTLLSRVTRARPKIAPYPFTTLEPNLGIVVLDVERQFVACDVPGLIADAHEGRGLGLKFLKHLERCRVLVVLADVTAESPRADADVVLHELSEYDPALAARARRIVLTKADLLAPELHATAAASAELPDARLISAHSGEGIDALLEELWAELASEPAEADS